MIDRERLEISALVNLYEQIQKLRIAEHNREMSSRRGADLRLASINPTAVHSPISRELGKIEKKLVLRIRDWVRRREQTLPILRELLRIKGVGEVLAAYLVSMIDIHHADTVSALWRFAGFGIVDGKAERPVRGQRLRYCKRLKVVCWRIAMSFLKSKSPYASIYYDARQYYERHRCDWSPLRCHHAAVRKMMKIFLQHMWERWRALEGLPVREPYVLEKMGHTTKYSPQDFGWAEGTDVTESSKPAWRGTKG